MIRSYLVACVAALTIRACPPAPTTPDAGPPEDLDAATTGCARACRNLAVLGCSEGLDASCSTTCVHTQTSRLTDLHTACLAAAKTKADARACRSVECK
jgi:hypothetical protein